MPTRYGKPVKKVIKSTRGVKVNAANQVSRNKKAVAAKKKSQKMK